MLDQQISQLLCRLRREEASVGIGQLLQLLTDRIQHRFGRMTETGYRSTSGSIQVALALGIRQPATFASNSGGQLRI